MNTSKYTQFKFENKILILIHILIELKQKLILMWLYVQLSDYGFKFGK